MGCPMTCLRTQDYLFELQSIPCKDELPGNLSKHPGWREYWRQYFSFAAINTTESQLTNVSDAGCALVQGPDSFFCGNGRLLSSLNAFCPVSCGCTLRLNNCP